MPEFYPLPEYTRSCVIKDAQNATRNARELHVNESMPLPYSNSQTRGELGDFLIDADDGSVSLLKRADFVAQNLSLDHYSDS